MGIQDSNLASINVDVNGTYERFDYVVAVSQDSINVALDSYLYNGLNEVILCYVYDNNGTPQQIDYNTFVTSANNTNPFDVPDATPVSDPKVQNLINANFAFAIKASLGMPPGVSPFPAVVTLKPGQSSITYTMVFHEFVATQIIWGERGRATWFNQSQPSGTAWSFTGIVDLNLGVTDFTQLPANVQQQIKDIGDPSMFSVQQLYYDLNNADLEQSFSFNGAPSNSPLSIFMGGDFLKTYWASLKANNGSVLGYGAKQQTAVEPTMLAVTNLNFFTPDLVGTIDPNNPPPLMLNYLCSINGNTLPDTTHAGFGWNWLDPDEVKKYDGVAAFNRNTFAQYLESHIRPYASMNSYNTYVKLTIESWGTSIDWNISRQPPTVSFPSTGTTILSYSNNANAGDCAGDGCFLGELTINSSYTMNVSVDGNKLIIDQHLTFYLLVGYAKITASGNIVDIKLTDTYEFSVDNQGKIVVSTPDAKATPPTSVRVDNSVTPNVSGFVNDLTDINNVINAIADYARGFSSFSLTDVPVSFIQGFVFPGGTTFSFTDVQFSDNQDFVSHITYADVAAYYARRQQLEHPSQSNS